MTKMPCHITDGPQYDDDLEEPTTCTGCGEEHFDNYCPCCDTPARNNYDLNHTLLDIGRALDERYLHERNLQYAWWQQQDQDDNWIEDQLQ